MFGLCGEMEAKCDVYESHIYTSTDYPYFCRQMKDC